MSLSRKRPTILRFVLSLFMGLLASGGLLLALQRYYQQYLEKSILREPFFILAGISALLIALFFAFPANRPSRLFKWLTRLIVVIVLLALLWAGGTFYIAQNDMLYMPGLRETNAEEALTKVPAVEEISFTGKDGRVFSGYFWKATPGKAGLILYFGGNGEPAAGRVYALVRDQAAALFPGYNFMMADYPGYGKSTGEPTEETILEMADAALAYARTRQEVDPARLVIAGWSLGTGPAAYLAASNSPAGLILMAPFYNGTELANSFISGVYLKGVKWPGLPSFAVRNQYPSDRYAAQTTVPTLILAGEADSLVPFAQSERLAARYSKAQLVKLAGGHTAPWTDPASFSAIAQFLGALQPPAQP